MADLQTGAERREQKSSQAHVISNEHRFDTPSGRAMTALEHLVRARIQRCFYRQGFAKGLRRLNNDAVDSQALTPNSLEKTVQRAFFDPL